MKMSDPLYDLYEDVRPLEIPDKYQINMTYFY